MVKSKLLHRFFNIIVSGKQLSSNEKKDHKQQMTTSSDIENGHHATSSLNIENKDEKNNKKERFDIIKNVFIISFAFMLLFTAFQSMAGLQSSINKDGNLGTVSLSIIYGALIISSMFVPSYVLKKVGEKWGMVVAMMGYSLYIAAQFYPRMYTLIPTAILLGLGAAPLWTAKCAYFTKVGQKYAELTETEVEPHIARFFGIFFLFFQASTVWGNIISSWALGIGREIDNNTTVISDEILLTCGVNYYIGSLPEIVNASSSIVEKNFETTDTQIYTLAGIYLACSLLSPIIISIFVDPLSRFTDESCNSKDEEKSSGLSLLVATFRHMKNKYQLLLIPITIWSGLEQGFLEADFTAAYITCGWGVHNVGYVLITYGVWDAIFSMGFGAVIKKIGRVPIFIFGACLNIVAIGIFFSWMPNPNQIYVFFILAALWGISDAVWQTLTNALYSVIFSGEESSAGFSNYHLWKSVGYILAYILQTQLSVYAKLWVLVASLALGMACYLTVEVIERRKPIEEKNNSN